MYSLNKYSVFLVLFSCTAVFSAITYKIPVRRFYPDRTEYARSSFSTPYYYDQYNTARHGQHYPYYGQSPYYHQRKFTTNDKFDHVKKDSPEFTSQIYKMGETSGRELAVPDEWNDLNWVVLIGRKPDKKKSQFKRKDMVKIKEFKKQQHQQQQQQQHQQQQQQQHQQQQHQQHDYTNPFLPPTYNYFITKNFDTLTGLHKVAGPPYDDTIPLNVTFDNTNHLAAASSVEEKKQVFENKKPIIEQKKRVFEDKKRALEEQNHVFIPSKQFVPSPAKSDPNSMLPIVPSEGRSFQKDAEAAPSEPLSSKRSSRSSHARSLDAKTSKLFKFTNRPSYTFNSEDARPKQSRMPRVRRVDARQIPFSKRTGITSGENTVKVYAATLGYPTRSYSRISRQLYV